MNNFDIVKKILKWIVIIFLGLIFMVILLGVYKFNYSASLEGYDPDGNKIIIENPKKI